MSSIKKLKLYNQCVARCKTSFSCPRCNEVMLPKEFEKHCTANHCIDSRLCCVWCLGTETWPRGKKSERVDDHLLQCWRKFMVSVISSIESAPLPSSQQTPPEPSRSDLTAIDYRTFDKTPMCEPRNLYGRSKIPDIPDRCYESVGELNLHDTVLPVHYEDSSLNTAVRCVLKYLQLEDSADWFHVMVRGVAMPTFLEALDQDDERIRLLPFGCWCDGGKFKLDKYRQHRHAIVVSSPKGRFERDFWPKIKPVVENTTEKDRPKYFSCAKRKRIVSRMHLVNTIGYLSQRKSRCNFMFDRNAIDEERLKHYWILQSLPADYRLALVTLWDGGISELIHQEFCHMDPRRLIGVPSMKVLDGKWQVRVSDIPGIVLNLVLPVSRPFVPSYYVSDRRGSNNNNNNNNNDQHPPLDVFFLHLTRGRKLYFRPRSQIPTSREEEFDVEDDADDIVANWTEIQARGGNRFYGIVGDETWAPSKYQQKFLDAARPLFERNMELESEVAKHKELEREAVQETRSLKRKLEIAEEENKSLLKEINLINKTVIADLRDRNAKLEQENAALKAENAALRDVGGWALKHVI